tara:strand:- start:1167 stop:1856 length:690 start_codon:yes stop_codon:yes gene_type:complete
MKRKRLIVFGCSYSAGMPDQKLSWPHTFAKNNPEYDVINYARGGSSLQFSIAMLHKFLKTNNDMDNTKIVFQITSPGRYTYNIQQILDADDTFYISENYKQIKNTPKIQAIVPNWNEEAFTKRAEKEILSKTQLQLYKDMIKHYPEICTDIEFESQASYVKSICDFTFYHMQKKSSIPRYLSIKYNNIPCIYSILGQKKFKKYVIDNGHHFGPAGFKYVAKFVKDNLSD